jgi:hypothetical protein
MQRCIYGSDLQDGVGMAQRGMTVDWEESRKLPRIAQVSEMRHARLGECRSRTTVNHGQFPAVDLQVIPFVSLCRRWYSP